MTYEEVLAGIHSRRTFSDGGATLERIRPLMEALGNPQENFKTVHIAGTNGKGSCCAMVDIALRNNGYQTGLFTSPYLMDFRERIRLNGTPISREQLISCYEAVMEQEMILEQQGAEPVNEFELVTAIGFLAFSRSNMDYVVLEVGLGGRTDPTNLISKPEVSVIMPISLDHTGVLGDTVEKIAGEKAGIIKPGCPVVTAKQVHSVHEVIKDRAKECSAPLHIADPCEPMEQGKYGSRFRIAGWELTIPLLGEHQLDNAATAWKACEVLGIANTASQQGFYQVSWPGRLQYFPGEPEILVDAGHNFAGITALTATLDRLFPGKNLLVVLAMMRDKDFEVCIPAVAKRARFLVGTTVGLPRSLQPEEVAEVAESYCPAYTAPNLKTALAMARAKAEPEDLILICGSVYAAGEALSLLCT